jgi:hypothetical protein
MAAWVQLRAAGIERLQVSQIATALAPLASHFQQLQLSSYGPLELVKHTFRGLIWRNVRRGPLLIREALAQFGQPKAVTAFRRDFELSWHDRAFQSAPDPARNSPRQLRIVKWVNTPARPVLRAATGKGLVAAADHFVVPGPWAS